MQARPEQHSSDARVGVVGAGRLGSALAARAARGGARRRGPGGPRRGARPAARDRALRARCRDRRGGGDRGRRGPLRRPHERRHPALSAGPRGQSGCETFGLHPLQTFAPPTGRARARGRGLRRGRLHPRRPRARRASWRCSSGMAPFEIDDEGRAAYHAAASMASNFLLTLEARRRARGRRAPASSADEARALLAPLVRRTVENWIALGPERALTGPVARGDELTVEAQRAAVEAARARVCSPLFDALVRRDPRRSPAAGCRHEDRAHGGRPARGARPRAARGAHHRPGAHDGLPPRGPPLADAPRARGVRRGGGLAVREPRPVRPGRGPRRVPARRGARRRAGRGRGRGRAVRPAGRRGLPRRVRHHGLRRRAHRGARGRPEPAAARSTSPG